MGEELFEFVNLAHYMDYIWVLSFGKRLSFLDHMEILWILKHSAKIINSIESLVFIGNKYCLNLFSNIFQFPITYASCDFDYLWNIYIKRKQKIWVLKPPAESMGRNVFLLKPNDTNVRAIIQSMTDEKTGKFCIMQEYLHEIKNGEKRVLVANGKVICFYLRIVKDNSDHRTNLHQGAQAEICALTKDEEKLCKKIGTYFLKMGIYFIGIDLVFPYVIEINIVNPGGLNTVYGLIKIDYSKNVVDEIFG